MDVMGIMKFIYIFILCGWMAKASESPPKHILKSIPVVDALIHRLEGEEWADDEQACFGDTLRILNGVKNDTLWATWIWDSMQPPLGVFYGSSLTLGNFDQCINSPWSSQQLSTQYCLVEAHIQKLKEPREFDAFDSADEYLNTVSASGRAFNHIAVGVCMPAICSPPAVAKFFSHLLQLSHIPDAEEVIVNPRDCLTSEQKPYTEKFYAFMCVFAILISIIVVSTVYTSCYGVTEVSKIDAIAKSFSITHNWTELFKQHKNEIRVFNGIRVITSFLVIASHQLLLAVARPSIMSNSIEVDALFNNFLGQCVLHIDLIVDSFLFISGLLLIKSLMSGRQKNLLIFLIKRYFRLIGPFVAGTLYLTSVSQYTTKAPFWEIANACEVDVCEKYWWKNILMLNYDLKTMCYGVSWYVTCDYHLAILAVVLFWIYRKSSRSGLIAFTAVSCGLTVQLAVMAYKKRLPLVPFNNVNNIAKTRDYDVLNDLYIRWHDRAGPYLVGVALGWFMSIYKPANHRNVISKNTSLIVVLCSLVTILVLFSMNNWLSNGGRVQVAVAIATYRIVWAVAVGAVIVALEYGSVDSLSNFLGNSFFAPISKLTYGMYMTHFFIIQRNLHALRSPLHFEIFNWAVSGCGYSVISCAAGLFLYLVVEAPCGNIANLFLSERNNKAELNNTKEANGLIAASNGLTTQTNRKAKSKEL